MSKKKNASPPPQQQMPRWLLGLLLLVAGPLAYIALGILWPLKPPLTNAEQGQAFGRGLASMGSVIAGVVLILFHFIRRKHD